MPSHKYLARHHRSGEQYAIETDDITGTITACVGPIPYHEAEEANAEIIEWLDGEEDAEWADDELWRIIRQLD